VAEKLVGLPIEVDHLITGGRNSRIYRVQSGQDAFALKQYPSLRDDPRDRLATEVGALRLMEQYRVDSVPPGVGGDREHGYALLSWIEGAEVALMAKGDTDAALAFLSAIHALRGPPGAADQPLAAEACLCGAEIQSQIEKRLALLRTVSPGERELVDFLEE